MNTSLDPTITSDPFIITRTFDAPRNKVWQAWTEQERLTAWFFWQNAFPVTVAKFDLRPSGTFHHGIRATNGVTWFKWAYVEVTAPERIVLESSFSNEAGDVVRHDLGRGWPLQLLVTMNLTEQHDETTLNVQVGPHAPSPAERETFDSFRDSMRRAWTDTFDRLTAYLTAA